MRQILLKTGIAGCLIVIFIVASFSFSAQAAEKKKISASAAQRVWYVSITGSDLNGNGSIENAIHTIQRAIDTANNGDTVVVMEGRYTGPGNTNLNFLGKTITVRSRDPEDDACMRATIIDAEGRGVIVRFINDEGPGSVFDGFTLIAGDTSLSLRGVPGFFEFSESAKPTMRRLRVGGDVSLKTKGQISSLFGVKTQVETGPPYGGRLWDGNNPFHQPVTTTDYYGSGDVDNDGELTLADVSLTQKMADGLAEPSHRADVDGNGLVNDDDVLLIDSALTGGIIPGWWNSLTKHMVRNAWVTKFMTIDQTDKHPWRYWFQCGTFATQTHIHGAFYRGDLYRTQYDGGQTVFNLPIYDVSATAPSYGHAINAILVGDDPLNFTEWRFLEPQTDYDVHPGMWDMPYGSTVSINVPGTILARGANIDVKVKFYVDETGWTLQDYSPDLILTRPSPDVDIPDNLPDLWNPRIVPVGQESMILFERSREDMSCMTDIHLMDLPFVDPPEGSPLMLSSQYSRLLDIIQGPDGAIHLLWIGKPGYIPGVFHGTLDTSQKKIVNVTRVSTGVRMVRMGRVIVTTGGEVHVFWLEERKTTISHPYDTGIYWTRWTGSGWQAEENLAPYMAYLLDWSNWNRRDFLRYYFDVDVSGDGDIILVWTEPISGSNETIVKQLRYNGEWGSSTIIETTNARGIELLTDSAGTLHIAYWLSDRDRGNLVYRTSGDGYSWSVPKTIDNSGNTCCPRMVAGTGGKVYLVWERKIGSQVVPVWNKYANGMWHDAQTLGVRSGADAWYPTLDLLSGGRLTIAWSSRSHDRVTIETDTITIQPPPESDLDGNGKLDQADIDVFISLFGTTVDPPGTPPDYDGDGVVGLADYSIFCSYF